MYSALLGNTTLHNQRGVISCGRSTGGDTHLETMRLSVLIDRATRYLRDHDYAPGTIANYAAIWRALSRYAQEHQTQVYTVDLGRAFLPQYL